MMRISLTIAFLCLAALLYMGLEKEDTLEKCLQTQSFDTCAYALR